jgi:hypothetical protein
MKHSTKNSNTGYNVEYRKQIYNTKKKLDSYQIQDISEACSNCEGLGWYYVWKGNLGHNDPDGVEVEQLCDQCGGLGISV